MPFRISLVAVVLLAATAAAAEVKTEVKTLKGEVIKGDLVSLDAKALVITDGDEKKTIPLTEVATLDFNAPAKLPANIGFHDIELTDGTILHCAELRFKGTDFKAKLVNDGPAVTISMKSVANVLWGANDPQMRSKWDARIAVRKSIDDSKIKNADGFGVVDGNLIQLRPVTVFSADDKGEILTFEKEGEKLTRKLEGVVGLYFHRTLDATAPAIICKVTDGSGSTIMVSSVVTKDGTVEVKTSAGATLVYKPEQLVRLDYSNANMAYLSDLTPLKVTEKTVTAFDRFRRDHNINGNGPIRIGSNVYAKGLAVHATTELEYKLKGEYLTLQGMAGLDHDVGGHEGTVVLRIYATTADTANQLIFEQTFNRPDDVNSPKVIEKNIKGVQLLRIVVTRSEANGADPIADMGLHLDLGDIRVVK
jgi:hypothetical protein